jgi:histidinol-phosphatase (PHP family)
MIVDYHTHTRLCKHAQGDVEDYVLKAIELGFDEIGSSDHAPLPDGFDDRHRMTVEAYYSSYAPAVSAIAEKYKDKIRIRRGIECDFLDRANDWTRKFIAENEFDFVIGSVHFVGTKGNEKDLFGPGFKGNDVEPLHEAYYQAIAESAKAGLFDIIAHCDLIKKIGRCSSKRVDELIREAMVQIKRSDLCIEINTSGLRKAEKEEYPSEGILAHARDLKIPLSLGSDAHTPGDVGKDFDRAIYLIETYGGGKIVLFDKRQRSEARVSNLRPGL